MPRNLFVWLCKRLALFPTKDAKYSEEFKESLELLGWDISPEEIISASRFLMVLAFFVFLILTLIFFIFDFPFIYPLIGMLIFPIIVLHVVTEYSKNKAKLEIMKALSESPRTLAYIVVLLKQNPNLEEAVRFASEFSEGKIAQDLKKALWDVWSGKAVNVKERLLPIADKWGKYSTDFKRTVYSIVASMGEGDDTRRNITLDRALKTLLDGILFKIKNFVNSLYVPTMILFSFGTVVPLMFISLLPVLGIFGIDIINGWSVGLFLLISLLLLYAYSNRIIAKRPSTFPIEEIPHMEGFPKEGELLIAGRRLPTSLVMLAIFFLIGFPGIVFVFHDIGVIHITLEKRLTQYLALSLVWAVGLDVTLYAYGKSHFKREILRKMKKLNTEIMEVMYTLSSRLMEGRPPEDAIYFVYQSFPGTELGKRMKIAYDNIKRRNATLSDALFNKSFGALKDVYSKTVLSLFKLFSVSAKKGHKTASRMLTIITSNFEELDKVEKELQNMLAKSMAMLKMTVLFIAPVISGVIVSLYDVLSTNLAMSQKQMSSIGVGGNLFGSFFLAKPPSLSVGMLALLIGLYLIGVTVVLTRYIVIIEEGPNKTRILENLYKVVPISLIIFTLSIILTTSLIGNL